jgi:hypothetical protein
MRGITVEEVMKQINDKAQNPKFKGSSNPECQDLNFEL